MQNNEQEIMYRNNDFIYEAVARLENLVNISIEIETSRSNYDAILNIRNLQFIVEAKSAMRASNQGLILSQLEEIKSNTNKPIILVADYISKDAANQLRERGFNYLETAGNTFINNDNLLIYIEGQKRKATSLNNQSRAFQEAGIKIIFHLLSKPNNLQDSYRTIAQEVGVSLGSVSNVMTELEDLNYLIKTSDKRVFKNKEELLERWLVEYNTVLKPRIIRSRMKFINSKEAQNWREMLIRNEPSMIWGGEPAGAILTNNLRPEEFTIYSNMELPEIAGALNLVPDKTGNVEVRQKFWRDEDVSQKTAPALLVYSDLINSGISRNLETANQIFKSHLQHII